MEEAINAIKNWPIILQGCLGSALFWLTLKLMTSSFNTLNKKFVKISKRSKKKWLQNEIAKVHFHLATDLNSKSAWLTGLIYRSLRSVVLAFMWLALGLILQAFYHPASIIGFIGFLFHLLEAHHAVKGSNGEDMTEERLQELKAEQAKLKSS